MSMITGSTVREFRELVDWSQADAAAKLGVAKKTVYNWEARGDEPLPDRAARRFVAHALDVVSSRGLMAKVPPELRAQLQARLSELPNPDGADAVQRDDDDAFARFLYERTSTVVRSTEDRDDLVRRLDKLHKHFDEAVELAEEAIELEVPRADVDLLLRGAIAIFISSGAFGVVSEALPGGSTQALENYARVQQLNLNRPAAPGVFDFVAGASRGEGKAVPARSVPEVAPRARALKRNERLSELAAKVAEEFTQQGGDPAIAEQFIQAATQPAD